MIANRYKPTGTTSGGGMGDIIQCTDTHLDRLVVIKRLQGGASPAESSMNSVL